MGAIRWKRARTFRRIERKCLHVAHSFPAKRRLCLLRKMVKAVVFVATWPVTAAK